MYKYRREGQKQNALKNQCPNQQDEQCGARKWVTRMEIWTDATSPEDRGLSRDLGWILCELRTRWTVWAKQCIGHRCVVPGKSSWEQPIVTICKTGSWRQGMIWCDGQKAMNGASLVAQMVKTLPAIQETQVWFLGQEDPPGGGNGNPFQSQHERGESKKALSGREDTQIVNFFFFRDKEGASKPRGTQEKNQWHAQSSSFLYDRKDHLQS